MHCEYCMEHDPACKKTKQARMFIDHPLGKIVTYAVVIGFLTLAVMTIGDAFGLVPLSTTEVHALTVGIILVLFLLVEARKFLEVFARRIRYRCPRCDRVAVRDATKSVPIHTLACDACQKTAYYTKPTYSTDVRSLTVIHGILTLYIICSFVWISFLGSFTELPKVWFNLFLASLFCWPATLYLMSRWVDNPLRPRRFICAGCGTTNDIRR